MSCGACAIVRQLASNYALSLDLALNSFVLAGFPRETVSKRAARARAAGSRAAAVFCATLTWIGNHVFGASRDHCTWAEDPTAPTIGAEVWHWSLPNTSNDNNG